MENITVTMVTSFTTLFLFFKESLLTMPPGALFDWDTVTHRSR